MLPHPAFHSFGRLPDVRFSTRTWDLAYNVGLLFLGETVLGLSVCENGP